METSLKNDFITTLNNKNVILFWSGGFESTFLLEFIIKHQIYLFCKITVIAVIFPQEIYTNNKIKNLANYFKDKNINLVILEPREIISHDYEYSSACIKCKKIRRDIILNYLTNTAHLLEKENVFLTGHNLDDLASYTLELISMQFDKKCKDTKMRFLECSNKFLKLFSYSDKISFYRPLIFYSKNDIKNIKEDIDCLNIIKKKCYWSNQRKRTLQKYIDDSRLDLSIQNVKSIFLKNFTMPEDKEFREIPFDTYLM